MTPILKRNVFGLALFALLAGVAPLMAAGNRFFAFIIGISFIHVLWASGMNLLSGYTGLMPLMFAGIAGISAYVSVDLVRAGYSFWLSLPVAILAAALIGAGLGLPSLRLKGFYFTLCSLVIQTVITLAFIYFSSWTNGDTGLSQIPLPPTPWGAPFSPLGWDLLLSGLAVAAVCAATLVVGSSLGQRMVAIREDDTLAETLGINVTRQKLLAFFVASVFAAVGGAFYAPYVGFISPRSFDVLLSLNIWLMVTFGGRGTIWGPVIGALLLAPTPYLLQSWYTAKDILYGLLIILVVIAMPDGLVSGMRLMRTSRKPSLRPKMGKPG